MNANQPAATPETALRQFFTLSFLGFQNRVSPNLKNSWCRLCDIASGKPYARARFAYYLGWHRKQIVFCFLLAFLLAGVDKVQQFFLAFATDIKQGAGAFTFPHFLLVFVGNGVVIFWLCYVFWHKPKETDMLPRILGKKNLEKSHFHNYYQKQGNVWGVSFTSALPLLLIGTSLAQSIIKYESTLLKTDPSPFIEFINGYPLLILLGTALLFLLLVVAFQPPNRNAASLEKHQGHLWRNLLFMSAIIALLVILFWFYHTGGVLYRSVSLLLLVFAPPLALAFLLNAFSGCMVKSASILKAVAAGKRKTGALQARRFKNLYDLLMWVSYLTAGVFLILVNMKSITANATFSSVVFPVAMLVFIGTAYFQAINWLAYNMSSLRFYLFFCIMALLILFGPQEHYEIKYKAPSAAGVMQRDSLEHYFLTWLKDRYDQGIMNDTNDIVYLVAAEGGGSRAGAWTTAMLTALDDTLQGKFKQQCFAISGISGGSLGAAAAIAWWDNAQTLQIPPNQLYAKDTARALYISKVFGRNYISTALAGLFFYDGFQQNILFSWLYPFQYSRTDRHQDEESDAVRLGLNAVFGDSQGKTLHPRYLKETDFLRLYYQNEYAKPRIGLPLFFPNTCRVEEGRRGVCSPLLLNTHTQSKGAKWPGNPGLVDIFDEKDKAGFANRRLSLGEVTNLSELFPFVNSTVHMGNKVGTFMDGGVYEVMGITTIYEIRKSLDAIQQKPDSGILSGLFADKKQKEAFKSKLEKVRFKILLIYNDPHVNHDEANEYKRTVQFIDPITTLLQVPFGGHTDYVYHKTILEFGSADVVEFTLQAPQGKAENARKAEDPIVMSRWLSKYEIKLILAHSEQLTREKYGELRR